MAGYEFESQAPDVDESRRPKETPENYVTRIAIEKARAVAAGCNSGTLVLGCDTTVVLDEEILGKPTDEADAARMLLSLADRAHVVYTGFALVAAGEDWVDRGIDVARVAMRPVTEQEAAAYAATGEPLDKAGAYALQGAGKDFVDHVEGLRSTVIGLPLEPIIDLLFSHGVTPALEDG